MTGDARVRLFVYGSLLQGERDHALISDAEFVGAAQTESCFHLVDLGAYAAIIRDGNCAISGELYLVDLQRRRAIDVARQVPILFRREHIRLADGSDAETYLMIADQVRGRRRLHHGDYRKRFAARVSRPYTSPLVQWAKGRFSK